MKKLILLFSLSAALFSCGKETAQKAENSSSKKPNVLLLIGDDIAFGDLGTYGSEIKTPHFDKLANSGVRFTNFHASPVCSVTRSMLMTGCNNIEVGLGSFDYSFYPASKGKPGYEGYLTENAATMSQLFNDEGYEVLKVGKWHLGGEAAGGYGPLHWGFTKEFGILSGGSNHWNNLRMTPVFSDPDYMHKKFKEHWTLNGEHYDRPDGVYSGELYTKQMIDFIKESQKDGKPWFSWMAFTTAHFPIQAPPELVEKHYKFYLEKGYEGLKQYRYKRLKAKGLISHDAKPSPENDLVKKWNQLSQKEKEYQAKVFATYAAEIEDQDNRIGQIMAYLKESGQLENTMIVYLSDNGPEGMEAENPNTGNAEFGKWIANNYDTSFEGIGTANSSNYIGTAWANAATGGLSWWKWFIGEGGIRVPMIIVPPGAADGGYAKAGEISNVVMSVKDIPMTILDYAGIKHPGTTYKGKTVVKPSGISARPFLDGKSDEVRSENDWYAFELFGNAYIMKGNYKLIKVRTGMFGDGDWHLYDVVKDPSESTPLEGSMKDRYKEMLAIYKQYEKDHQLVQVDADWNAFKAASE
ncbi:arylsulfatase [Flammeovirga kamogawensis]|uniref:Arylsulfatase n=1 Tax=Flammeovirga kamogawensis TaxID=373891 RepID=A0ABX8GPD8_9BACT|nr:arylsulfatase [Flammeovirga kamogawensis]MBB6463481.1 arylsulfatase [Flammeovirga kamogawensis]QWG05593.1 arylsulfatase [Flammeovirga kamogawensis]TRX67425.1 arylsulfatase [Flammeovirga kamogawensis]